MINHFNSNIAVEYSINESIFVQQLSEWTFLNLANKRHIYDGLCWSFNTLDAYGEIFPYWSRRQLETIINNLVSHGLVAKGNYNAHKYDRTCWYALTEMALAFYPELTQEKYLLALSDTISPNCEMYDTTKTKNQNAEIHFTKLCQAFHRTVTTIPTTNTTKDISNDISTQKHKSVNEEYKLEDLAENNPHNIPEQMLKDFLTVKKSKKSKVTGTSWGKINKTLIQIEKEVRIKPIDAFETMVANCWQSLDVKYFKEDAKRSAATSEPAYF